MVTDLEGNELQQKNYYINITTNCKLGPIVYNYKRNVSALTVGGYYLLFDRNIGIPRRNDKGEVINNLFCTPTPKGWTPFKQTMYGPNVTNETYTIYAGLVGKPSEYSANNNWKPDFAKNYTDNDTYFLHSDRINKWSYAMSYDFIDGTAGDTNGNVGLTISYGMSKNRLYFFNRPRAVIDYNLPNVGNWMCNFNKAIGVDETYIMFPYYCSTVGWASVRIMNGKVDKYYQVDATYLQKMTNHMAPMRVCYGPITSEEMKMLAEGRNLTY